MNEDGHPSRGRPKKKRIDSVKHDIRIKGVSMEMTSDRREWKKKTCYPTKVGLSGIRNNDDDQLSIAYCVWRIS
jgi:hypothetical protein